MSYWQARLSGSFHLCSPDRRASVPRGKKARAIVAYVCAKSGTHIRREHLVDLLWGDRGKAQARDSLRQALMEIRRCATGLIQSDRDCVWIEADQLVVCDDNTDEFLADLDHITPELDCWLARERRRRSELHWEMLRLDAERLLSEGRGAAALKCAERMEQIDRYHEEWVRLAMRAEFQTGCPGRIDQRFRAISDMLHRELGVEPAGETRVLRDTLIAQLSSWTKNVETNRREPTRPDRPAAEPVAKSAAYKISGLPTARRAAVAAICTATAMVGAALLVAANLPQKTLPLRLQCCPSSSIAEQLSFPITARKSLIRSSPTCPG